MKASQEIALLRHALVGLLDGSPPTASEVEKRGFVYQPANATSGLIVSYELYTSDKMLYESGSAGEVGLSGRYVKVFDILAPMVGWFVLINDNAGGKGCKMF